LKCPDVRGDPGSPAPTAQIGRAEISLERSEVPGTARASSYNVITGNQGLNNLIILRECVAVPCTAPVVSGDIRVVVNLTFDAKFKEDQTWICMGGAIHKAYIENALGSAKLLIAGR
jgi:hypothetical protein